MAERTLQRAFTVKPIWDEDAGVWTSESDIQGLHVEAATLDQLEALVMEFAPELIVANHIGSANLARIPLADAVPIIRWLTASNEAA